MADRPIPEGLSHMVPWLRYPVCTAPLELTGRTLGCENRHYFDIARQEYLNLLLRIAPENADTPGMLAACDRFLSTGWYEPPIRGMVTALAGARQVPEVGVGAGHYIRTFLDKTPEAVGLAVDVSPTAYRRAAGCSPRLESVVADIWRRSPIATGSLEAMLCVFASRNPAKFVRMLSPDGRLVVVTPGRGHLVELRGSLGLLGLDPEKLERPNGSMAGLDLVDRQEFTHPLNLSAEAAADLVAMSPNAFHTHKASAAAKTTVAFVTSTFRRLQIHVPNREDGPASRNL